MVERSGTCVVCNSECSVVAYTPGADPATGRPPLGYAAADGSGWWAHLIVPEDEHWADPGYARGLVDWATSNVFLCSQCGERPSSMVKVGTTDGWCTTCIEFSVEPDKAADRCLICEESAPRHGNLCCAHRYDDQPPCGRCLLPPAVGRTEDGAR